MIGYSEIEVFSDVQRMIALVLTTQIEKIKDMDYGSGVVVRCHELVRACAKLYLHSPTSLRICDGKYACADHSWLAFDGERAILDVYACARLPMVQLVDVGSSVVGYVQRRLYEEGMFRTDIDNKMVDTLWQKLREEPSWKDR